MENNSKDYGRAKSDHRLDRIEQKIDKLSDAMISLARAEERQIALETRQSHHFARQNKMSEKIEELDKLAQSNAHTVNILNRITYVIAAAVIGGLIKIFLG